MIDRLKLGDAYSATIGRTRSQDRDKSRVGMAADSCEKGASGPRDVSCAGAIEGVLLLDIDQIIFNASELFGSLGFWYSLSAQHTTACIVIRSH